MIPRRTKRKKTRKKKKDKKAVVIVESETDNEPIDNKSEYAQETKSTSRVEEVVKVTGHNDPRTVAKKIKDPPTSRFDKEDTEEDI